MCLFSKFSNLDDISSHRVTLLYDLFNVYIKIIFSKPLHLRYIFIRYSYPRNTNAKQVSLSFHLPLLVTRAKR